MRKVNFEYCGQDKDGKRLTFADFCPPYYEKLQLGQKDIIKDMANRVLQLEQDMNRIDVLCAPCGSGKSVLTNGIAALFAGQKIGGCIILTDENRRLENDIAHAAKRYPNMVCNLSDDTIRTAEEMQLLMDKLPSICVVALSVQRYNMMSQKTRELLWKFYDERGRATYRDRLIIYEELLDVESVSMSLSDIWNWANQYQQRISGEQGIHATEQARRLVQLLENKIRGLPTITFPACDEKNRAQSLDKMQEGDYVPLDDNDVDINIKNEKKVRAVVFSAMKEKQIKYESNRKKIKILLQEAEKKIDPVEIQKSKFKAEAIKKLNELLKRAGDTEEDIYMLNKIMENLQKEESLWLSPTDQKRLIAGELRYLVPEIQMLQEIMEEQKKHRVSFRKNVFSKKLGTLEDLQQLTTKKPEKWLKDTIKIAVKQKAILEELSDRIVTCAEELLEDLYYVEAIPRLDEVERNHYNEMQENKGDYEGIRYEVFRNVFTGKTIIQNSGDGSQKKNTDSLMRIHTVVDQMEKLPIGKIKIFVMDGTANQSPIYKKADQYKIVNYEKPQISGQLILLNEYSGKWKICNENGGKMGIRLAAEINQVIAANGIRYEPKKTMLSTYKTLQSNFQEAGITNNIVATHGNITGTNIYRNCETLIKVGGLLMPMFTALLAVMGRNPEIWDRLEQMSENQQILELNRIITYNANAGNSVFYVAVKDTIMRNALVRTVQEVNRLRMRGWPSAETPAEDLSYRIIWLARCRRNYDAVRATPVEELVHEVAGLLGLQIQWHNSVLDPYKPPVAERVLAWIQAQPPGTEFTRDTLVHGLEIDSSTLKRTINRDSRLKDLLNGLACGQGGKTGRCTIYRIGS